MPDTPESQIENHLIDKLVGLKYVYRADIRDPAEIETNIRQLFLSSFSHSTPQLQRSYV